MVVAVVAVVVAVVVTIVNSSVVGIVNVDAVGMTATMAGERRREMLMIHSSRWKDTTGKEKDPTTTACTAHYFYR